MELAPVSYLIINLSPHPTPLCAVILGNAYLSQFFTTSSEPKLLKQSMSAYNQAVRTLVSPPCLLYYQLMS